MTGTSKASQARGVRGNERSEWVPSVRCLRSAVKKGRHAGRGRIPSDPDRRSVAGGRSISVLTYQTHLGQGEPGVDNTAPRSAAASVGRGVWTTAARPDGASPGGSQHGRPDRSQGALGVPSTPVRVALDNPALLIERHECPMPSGPSSIRRYPQSQQPRRAAGSRRSGSSGPLFRAPETGLLRAVIHRRILR